MHSEKPICALSRLSEVSLTLPSASPRPTVPPPLPSIPTSCLLPTPPNTPPLHPWREFFFLNQKKIKSLPLCFHPITHPPPPPPQRKRRAPLSNFLYPKTNTRPYSNPVSCALVAASCHAQLLCSELRELCESRGGCLGFPPSIKVPTASVDVKQH